MNTIENSNCKYLYALTNDMMVGMVIDYIVTHFSPAELRNLKYASLAYAIVNTGDICVYGNNVMMAIALSNKTDMSEFEIINMVNDGKAAKYLFDKFVLVEFI